jgi:hypothetical protein
LFSEGKPPGFKIKSKKVFLQKEDACQMKEKYFLKTITDSQRRVFIDTVQLYEAYMDTFQKSQSYSGGMHWKKSKDRQYLFRTRDRYGYGKSLGVRSEKTEKILDAYRKAKREQKERLAYFKERLKEQARFCKAAMIQRVPRVVANILRRLNHQKLLGKNVIVVGTNALYAYEAAAGVFFDSPIMATRDMDILWDIRPKLTLVADEDIEPGGLLGILKKTDRSFELLELQKFRAVNREGYMVDLIKAEPKKMIVKEKRRMGKTGDLEAAEIKNLQWLLSSPKFSQIVIGVDGFPAEMITHDPRAFCMHKFWLSSQPEREPIKRERDLSQGLAVARLVLQYLPQYAFKDSELRMFPKDVVDKARAHISEIDAPPGFDLE